MDNGALLRVNRNTYNADPGNTINWTISDKPEQKGESPYHLLASVSSTRVGIFVPIL